MIISCEHDCTLLRLIEETLYAFLQVEDLDGTALYNVLDLGPKAKVDEIKKVINASHQMLDIPSSNHAFLLGIQSYFLIKPCLNIFSRSN